MSIKTFKFDKEAVRSKRFFASQSRAVLTSPDTSNTTGNDSTLFECEWVDNPYPTFSTPWGTVVKDGTFSKKQELVDSTTATHVATNSSESDVLHISVSLPCVIIWKFALSSIPTSSDHITVTGAHKSIERSSQSSLLTGSASTYYNNGVYTDVEYFIDAPTDKLSESYRSIPSSLFSVGDNTIIFVIGEDQKAPSERGDNGTFSLFTIRSSIGDLIDTGYKQSDNTILDDYIVDMPEGRVNYQTKAPVDISVTMSSSTGYFSKKRTIDVVYGESTDKYITLENLKHYTNLLETKFAASGSSSWSSGVDVAPMTSDDIEEVCNS